MYESDSDMVGLIATAVDLKLEKYTRTAEVFPQHNWICGYCTQPRQKATYIKHANHKVIREGKPMYPSASTESSTRGLPSNNS